MFSVIYADTPTLFVDKNMIDKFYFDPNFSSEPYIYDENQWGNKILSFYFIVKEDIYRDLEKVVTIEQQFITNGNKQTQ